MSKCEVCGRSDGHFPNCPKSDDKYGILYCEIGEKTTTSYEDESPYEEIVSDKGNTLNSQ